MYSGLDPFFSLHSVAVIGATQDPHKLGYAVVDNLTHCGFQGRIYPINPKGGEILGLETYASVLEVPDTVDLAVIVIPAPLVVSVLEECGRKGLQGVIIITSGFGEVGGEDRKIERQLTEIAQKYSLRLLGPNCLGIIDTIIPLNASFAEGMPSSGNISFMSQSGALAEAVLDWATAEGIGFARFVTLGNKSDLSEIDFIQAWGDDEHSKVILAYLEDIRDGAQFMSLARRVTRDKGTPIIAIKSGTTDAGTRAVSSHTGSLAGSERAYDAAFKQSGVIRADSVESLFDYSIAFAYQPIWRGNRLAIVTNAGGPGILATDAAERAGLRVANLASETINLLRDKIPGIASALNPIDVRGDALEDRYEIALRLGLADPNVDGALVILTPQKLTRVKETAQILAEISSEMKASGARSRLSGRTESAPSLAFKAPSYPKPVLACFMGEAHVKEGITILNAHNVPNYSFPERAIAALRAMWQYRQWLDGPLATLPQFDMDRDKIHQIFAQVRANRRVALVENEARAVAEAIGLALPNSQLARHREEAVAIARHLGYPVVFKISSPEILHKSDVGGVKTGISNDSEARDAFQLITSRAVRFVPGAQVWGVTVQEMIAPGKEVIIGMSRDPQFGPDFLGAVINEVPPPRLEFVEQSVVPFLQGRGVGIYATLPQERLLSAFSVNEIAEFLGCEVLNSPEQGEQLVENFLVGAMSVDSALSYFRRTLFKAVITGGDRSDIQLAALETSTRCIILTGGIRPSPIILSRAEELNVPMLLAKQDTLSVVEVMEQSFGKMHFYQPRKVACFQELLAKRFDFERLYADLGIQGKSASKKPDRL